jgi:hypothetical protein
MSCGTKHPLKRSGTSQAQRMLPALKDDYVRIDENEYADWISFAKEFSRYIRYYTPSGGSSTDWSAFFSNDVSALLGYVAIQDVDAYRDKIRDLFDYLRDEHNVSSVIRVEKKLNTLFAGVFSLAKFLDDYYLSLAETLETKNLIKSLVRSKLKLPFKRLIAYYKGASLYNYLHQTDLDGWRILNREVELPEYALGGNGFSSIWYDEADWNAFYAGIAIDDTIFGNNGLVNYFIAEYDPDPEISQAEWVEFRRINHAAKHNLFTSLFDNFLMVYNRLVSETGKELMKTLTSYNAHAPHYALFLSFLRLFRQAQQNMNSIGRRHLDFYYKDVLQLRPKKAEPDKAHVIIELAKTVDEYLLGKDTLFKAGKDSAGNEMYYSLAKEQTFNKAQTVSFKSVYLGDSSIKAADDHTLTIDPASANVDNRGRLFAAPVINSSDGIGGALTTSNLEWHPFVNKQFIEGMLADIAIPNALIGFAFASHYLFLAEGARTIMLAVNVGSDYIKLASVKFDCYLTTEKEWLKVPAASLTNNTTVAMGTSVTGALFKISLTGDDPAITAYNAEVHGGRFNTDKPIIKLVLINEDASPYPFTELKDIVISSIEIKVEVGKLVSGYNQDGIKNLVISNDNGSVEAAKPFEPFGTVPVAGSRLIIGNKEVFTKKNLNVRLNIEWKGLPADFKNISYYKTSDRPTNNYSMLPDISLKELQSGKWETRENTLEIFSATSSPTPQVVIPSTFSAIENASIDSYKNDYSRFNINSRKGFITIELKEDFRHSYHQADLVTYLVEKAAKVTSPQFTVEPVKPYTPVMQSVFLSYDASDTYSFSDSTALAYDAREHQFFHLYPFGNAEQHGYLSDGTAVNLFPRFYHGERVDHTAEFYIGFEKLTGQQAVSVLFQVLEGTSDPLLEKPEKHITWSYLSNDRWKDFDPLTISDNTLDLVKSGIIQFTIPADATTDNNLLDSGYLWIRAAVEEAAMAVSKLIAVTTQAALLSHYSETVPAFTVLPAGKIKKLKNPQPAIKKANQPFSSFSGHDAENYAQYYIRSSERLRHKRRAITLWDYERLVLDKFPQIHKVKCLTHTQFQQVDDTIEYNEVKPGYVCIITLPDLLSRNDTDPLRPYTNQSTLTEIENYLQSLTSCHAKVLARHPDFEEVTLSFELKLHEDYPDFGVYRKQLQQEIVEFLTPWAYDTSAEIDFGGTVHKSVLVNFIEERPYVNYITNVVMKQIIYKPVGLPVQITGETAQASTARSILVSAPASKHLITEIVELTAAETAECIAPATVTA